jgi:hypothetical protein
MTERDHKQIDAPEKIWACDTCSIDDGWLHGQWQSDRYDNSGRVEYLRADIAERQIAELRAKLNIATDSREFWKKAAEDENTKLVVAEADKAQDTAIAISAVSTAAAAILAAVKVAQGEKAYHALRDHMRQKEDLAVAEIVQRASLDATQQPAGPAGRN